MGVHSSTVNINSLYHMDVHSQEMARMTSNGRRNMYLTLDRAPPAHLQSRLWGEKETYEILRSLGAPSKATLYHVYSVCVCI